MKNAHNTTPLSPGVQTYIFKIQILRKRPGRYTPDGLQGLSLRSGGELQKGKEGLSAFLASLEIF